MLSLDPYAGLSVRDIISLIKQQNSFARRVYNLAIQIRGKYSSISFGKLKGINISKKVLLIIVIHPILSIHSGKLWIQVEEKKTVPYTGKYIFSSL